MTELSYGFALLLVLFLFQQGVRADEGDLSPQKWDEVNGIIDDIKSESAPQNLKLELKTGLIQIQTNVPNSIRLGQGNSVLAAGVLVDYLLTGPWSLEASYLYGVNAFTGTNSPNGSSTNISWLDAGPRYTILLDSTKLDNYLAFKLLYHQNDSQFQLVSDGTVTNPMFMTHYMGVALGVERSIPFSRNFGLLASFNLLQILASNSPSLLGFIQSGYGFEISGELYYQFQLFHKTARLGLAYWQQGNENNFDNTGQALTGENSYVQVSKALLGDFSLHF